MDQYSETQLNNIVNHCLAEVEARKFWADNLTEEIQNKLPMQAIVFANDVYCTPTDRLVARLIDHFYKTSHRTENGEIANPDAKRQWDAAIAGEDFEGEFSFFQTNFSKPGATRDFTIWPRGM